jgi:hypothetical protein
MKRPTKAKPTSNHAAPAMPASEQRGIQRDLMEIPPSDHVRQAQRLISCYSDMPAILHFLSQSIRRQVSLDELETTGLANILTILSEYSDTEYNENSIASDMLQYIREEATHAQLH